MLYLIKNLHETYTIAVADTAQLYQDSTHVYSITHNTYIVNGKTCANVIHMPNIDSVSYATIRQNLLNSVNNIYSGSRDKILLENKDKFIIAVIQFKPDNSKDVLYANFYANLINDPIEYNNILPNSPMYHYEIYNYHTGKFEVFIKHEDAMKKLEQYMNDLIIEYKSTFIKEFYDPEDFLLYIDSITV